MVQAQGRVAGRTVHPKLMLASQPSGELVGKAGRVAAPGTVLTVHLGNDTDTLICHFLNIRLCGLRCLIIQAATRPLHCQSSGLT